MLTQTLYGDPTNGRGQGFTDAGAVARAPQKCDSTSLTLELQPLQSEADKPKASSARKYILGACELFPETPILVDFTQFTIFAATADDLQLHKEEAS